MRFTDRSHAGIVLAGLLDHLADHPAVILGLPRGGVPVGFEIARHLAAPLEVLLVRKLGVPVQPELAMGAIGEGGVRVLDEQRIERLGIRPAAVERVERRERRELARQAERFRGNARPADLEGKTAVIVDDGIATGATARAACLITRRLGAGRVVLAVRSLPATHRQPSPRWPTSWWWPTPRGGSRPSACSIATSGPLRTPRWWSFWTAPGSGRPAPSQGAEKPVHPVLSAILRSSAVNSQVPPVE